MVIQAIEQLEQTEGSITAVLEFVNTRFDGKGGHIERFGSSEDFAGWARERGLVGDEMVTESDVAAARELREALVAVMLAHAGHPDLDEEQLRDAERKLEHAGERYPVRITLSAAGSSIASQARGAAGVFGTVLAAANDIAAHDAWWRMKGCCSYPCRHGFVDRTKNGTQRFCSTRCASRAAMRAMRERRRELGD